MGGKPSCTTDAAPPATGVKLAAALVGTRSDGDTDAAGAGGDGGWEWCAAATAAGRAKLESSLRSRASPEPLGPGDRAADCCLSVKPLEPSDRAAPLPLGAGHAGRVDSGDVASGESGDVRAPAVVVPPLKAVSAGDRSAPGPPTLPPLSVPLVAGFPWRPWRPTVRWELLPSSSGPLPPLPVAVSEPEEIVAYESGAAAPPVALRGGLPGPLHAAGATVVAPSQLSAAPRGLTAPLASSAPSDAAAGAAAEAAADAAAAASCRCAAAACRTMLRYP
jgi:hypothetical protein